MQLTPGQEFPNIGVREWVACNRCVMEAYDGGGLIFLLFMDSEWLERDLELRSRGKF